MKDSLGLDKYPELTRLVKAVVVLSHGNADPERGFSQAGNFITEARTSLSQSVVNALQSTKDGLKQYNNQCHTVPITKDFLRKGVNAHKSYIKRLEEEKRLKAELKKKREAEKEVLELKKAKEEEREKEQEAKSRQTKTFLKKEKELELEESKSRVELDTYSTLIKEANDRIKEAMKKSDIKGVKIGQTMLETAHQKMEDATKILDEIRKEQKNVEKHKRTMLDYFSKPAVSKKK